MAEERNLATARAPEAGDAGETDPTKAELQRRMDEARESITQTVQEIKETVTTQYQNVRETISQQLDWREQYRRRPLAFTAGAVGVGLLVGYSVGGAFAGGDSDLDERYYEAEGEYDDEDVSVRAPAERGYAAQAITGGSYGSTAYASQHRPLASTPAGMAAARESVSAASEAYERGMERQQSEGAAYGSRRQADGRTYEAAPQASALPDARPSYSSGYQNPLASGAAGEEQPSGPGLFERFKETQAYDRLQQELQTLGSRAVEELSKTAQNVVLPALLGKLKDLIGIDLSTQREVAQRSRLEHQTAHARTQTEQAAEGTQGGSQAAPGGTAYAASGGTSTP
jgi:ElaB/YqjD/DUF883 family membrane-anchored ribosome-binding protein